MQHKPSWWYASIIGAPVKWFGVWVMEQYAESASFLSCLPLGYISFFTVAFVLGLLAQDVSNKDSWIWKNYRLWRRLYIIEQVVPANANDNSHSWLEITVYLKFISDIKDAEVIVRVHSNYTIEHAKDVFLINTRNIPSIHKDHREKIIIGIIPLESHDGSPSGYQVWGDTYRKSGDVSGMKDLFNASNNFIEVTVKCGRYEQTEKVFLCMASQRGGELGKFFAMYDGDGANGNRKILKFRRG